MKALLAAVFTFAAAFVAEASVKGEMSSPLLACGGGRAFVISQDGSVLWEKSGCGNIHRVWLYRGRIYWSNGNLYRTEVSTKKTELVYQPCDKEGVFGFEILKNGNIVVAENGTDFISELKAGTHEPVIRFKADSCDLKGKISNKHHHFRMIRKSAKGTYLVCCSGANIVREYDAKGNLLWEQPTPALAFDVLRRANGNTLVSHLDAVTEYTPDHKIAWQFRCEDVPEGNVKNLCGIWEKENKNLVIGTYANGSEEGDRPTAFEVTRDKKIVWAYSAKGKNFSMMTAFPLTAWNP